MSKFELSEALTHQQREAITHAGESHHALAAAQMHLYAALGAAQKGRERGWAEGVVTELEHAKNCVLSHHQDVVAPHGLYAEIELDAPHLVHRVEKLRSNLKDIEKRIESLLETLKEVQKENYESIGKIRRNASKMLNELQKLMAEESDLVFERFEEPPALD